MKTIAFILIALISISGYSQTSRAFAEVEKNEVPNEVLMSFKDMEPKIAADSWKVERTTYEAKFKKNNNWVFHRFNDEGLFLETRTLKNWEEASEELVNGKKKTTYKYYDVIEFYEAETADEDKYYVLMLEDEETDDLQTLYFENDGSLRDKSKSGY